MQGQWIRTHEEARHLHRVTRQTPGAALSGIAAHAHGTRRASQARGASDSDRTRLATITPLALRPGLAISTRSARRSCLPHRPCGPRLARPACHTLQPGQTVLAWEPDGSRCSRRAPLPSGRLLLA